MLQLSTSWSILPDRLFSMQYLNIGRIAMYAQLVCHVLGKWEQLLGKKNIYTMIGEYHFMNHSYVVNQCAGVNNSMSLFFSSPTCPSKLKFHKASNLSMFKKGLSTWLKFGKTQNIKMTISQVTKRNDFGSHIIGSIYTLKSTFYVLGEDVHTS